jgi:uncharacterized protein YbjT (DUF2867 family)
MAAVSRLSISDHRLPAARCLCSESIAIFHPLPAAKRDRKLSPMAETPNKVALVAGSSGLVGGRLLPLLLGVPDYMRVYALTRRPVTLDHPRLANRVVRFEAPLEAQLQGLQCQDAYCCLGTTRKNAGSDQAFRAVDHDLVLKFAAYALSAGAERFIVVSSVGADAGAKNLYLRTKGETERDLEQLRFRGLSILQPSMLLGSRRELRVLELLALPAMYLLSPLLLGKSARFRAIAASEVAAAMLGAARSQRKGVNRYTYNELRKLAVDGQR